MNPDYLSHIFSTKAGASLSSYIMDERMAAAKRLLATTSFSPQQICDQIGIENVSYFYRQFKKSSAQKNRVSWDFFVPMHSVSFLTHKNPPDPLSDNSASSPDLSPGCSA